MSDRWPTGEQSGGLPAHGIKRLPAPLAIPATATQTAARCHIFTHRQRSHELPLLPLTVNREMAIS